MSELALTSEVSAAAAADARAMGSASVFLGVAALLAGIVKDITSGDLLLYSAAFFVLAGIVAGYSARPREFYFPGTRFDGFDDDLRENKDMLVVLEQMARLNDKHSRFNRAILFKNSRVIVFSYMLAICGAVFAVLPQLSVWTRTP